MSIFIRRVLLCLLGLLAGLAAWPAAELILALQESFPTYLLFGAALGGIVGIVMGAVFGSAEGITSHVKSRIPAGLAAGAIMGAVGGALGFVAGQGVFLFAANSVLESPESLGRWGLVVSRSVGWAVLGIAVGMAEGFRAISPRKILIGGLGGLIGGLVGGAVLEYSQVFLPGFATARLAGLLAFGVFVGVAYAVIEKQMSRGVLRVLNGPLKGKEFVINQNRMRIGRSRRAEIRLDGYRNVSDVHAQLRAHGHDLTVRRRENNGIQINDRDVDEHTFKYEDILKIGSAKLYYRYE